MATTFLASCTRETKTVKEEKRNARGHVLHVFWMNPRTTSGGYDEIHRRWHLEGMDISEEMKENGDGLGVGRRGVDLSDTDVGDGLRG
ncbi:hypothetical protein HPP92_015056 [Vanilla planifolia]|uniref:Uncharacterized protein n=1 Tax=Vanilla planifolia TaxID=51239 RepID=A0A835UVY3_VANPL|nr:hypothetical protein HPP92_015568 [Vanilla planifolia]KAG0475370.1 hypothetical protein HPP92_015056 [Vanilla planifolia]